MQSSQHLSLSWNESGNNGHIVVRCTRPHASWIKIWFVELYMRSGSHDNYPGGVIPHTTRMIDVGAGGSWMRLRCDLQDGVVVMHRIACRGDCIEIQSEASNPTDRVSGVAWGAPCVIVENFTGCDSSNYLNKCFIFLEERLERMPVHPWAVDAIETPGQVWCPASVGRADVEPHPLSELVPSNGLIGCFSKDEKHVCAIAWQPYQNLFQGIITCLHADFGINGLEAGESKKIRGVIYLTEADIPGLLQRYRQEFPEHYESRRLNCE